MYVFSYLWKLHQKKALKNKLRKGREDCTAFWDLWGEIKRNPLLLGESQIRATSGTSPSRQCCCSPAALEAQPIPAMRSGFNPKMPTHSSSLGSLCPPVLCLALPGFLSAAPEAPSIQGFPAGAGLSAPFSRIFSSSQNHSVI